MIEEHGFKAEFDPDTQAWFDRNPDAQTTVQRCDRCGLYFKPSLGHHSRNCKVRGTKEEPTVEKRRIVKTEGIVGIKTARNAAIKACIHDTPELYAELKAMLPDSHTTLHYAAAIEELILKRHIRAINEQPVARIGTGRDSRKYVIDVYHTIAWEAD